MRDTNFSFEDYLKEKIDGIECHLKELNGKTVDMSNWIIRNNDLPDRLSNLTIQFQAHYKETARRFLKADMTRFRVKMMWLVGGALSLFVLQYLSEKL